MIMKLSHTHQWPAPRAERLLVCLLATEQLQATATRLNQLLGATANLQAAQAEKDKKRLLYLNGQAVALLGVGEKAGAETYRQACHHAVSMAKDLGFTELLLLADPQYWQAETWTAVAESLLLSSYTFDTYKSEKEPNSLEQVQIFAETVDENALERGIKLAEATCIARDLVNEPVITLTATELGNRIRALGKQYGFEVDVWNKKKIQSMKMGGLLAVNAGSIEPPTFSILTYHTENTRHTRPVVLVGKGVVFDTGGLSLKPTANSMDFMKADMAGAAAVVGAMCGIAALGLDCHVVGLIPATDNRPGENAYTPGDVIHMHDGSTVEVLNTDAEGRMILADALAYAKKYEPALVIDLATLTGAAVVAVGNEGIAMMGTDEQAKQQLMAAGERVYERLVAFPLWDEYREQLKSDIADLKNIGGRGAGAITAAKFLQHFTDYPWIHLDIAGPSWLQAASSYRGKNATGVGVRLLLDFISNYHFDYEEKPSK